MVADGGRSHAHLPCCSSQVSSHSQEELVRGTWDRHKGTSPHMLSPPPSGGVLAFLEIEFPSTESSQPHQHAGGVGKEGIR